MNRKITLLGLIILVTGSVFVFQALHNQSGTSSEMTYDTTNSYPMPAVSDTTPSAANVAQQVKMEISELDKYVSSHPSDTTHVLRLARLYQDSHQPAKAIPLYERYLKMNKESGVQPWLDLTNCYGATKNWTKALDATKRTLKQFQNNPSALYNQGAIYANMGKYEKARSVWKKVLKTHATADVMNITRQSLQKLGNPPTSK